MERELPLQEVLQEDLDGQPGPFRQLREHNFRIDHDSVVHLPQPTAQQRQRQRAYYLANVTMIDEKIGELLRALEERGYLENAVVIFTSDHGDCLTDHGHSQKWTMYDQIVRVPLVVCSPGRVDAGQRVLGMCQLMDLGRTVLELAGVEAPADMQAGSLVAALNADTLPDWSPRELVFAEHPADGIYEGPYMTMVRSRHWKLVHFLDSNEGQLFDLRRDADEFHNLWDDPDCAAVKRELLDAMLDWRIQSGLQTRKRLQEWR